MKHPCLLMLHFPSEPGGWQPMRPHFFRGCIFLNISKRYFLLGLSNCFLSFWAGKKIHSHIYPLNAYGHYVAKPKRRKRCPSAGQRHRICPRIHGRDCLLHTAITDRVPAPADATNRVLHLLHTALQDAEEIRSFNEQIHGQPGSDRRHLRSQTRLFPPPWVGLWTVVINRLENTLHSQEA